jgi:hypothetical protein
VSCTCRILMPPTCASSMFLICSWLSSRWGVRMQYRSGSRTGISCRKRIGGILNTISFSFSFSFPPWDSLFLKQSLTFVTNLLSNQIINVTIGI